MSLTLRAENSFIAAPGARPGIPWTALAIVAAVLIGALYPVTALVVGPFGLPAAVLALLLVAVSRRRPGLGVALAFLLTSLTPGLVGPRAWMPGVAWTVLLFAMLVLRPTNAAADGSVLRLPPMALPVLVYAATVLVAYAVSPAPDLGLPILRSTVSGVLLFVVAAMTLRSWPDITTVLRGSSGAAALVGGFACLQHVLGLTTGIGFITSTGALIDRATAGFGHPNLLGGFLVVLVPLAAAAAVLDRRWRLLHLAGMVLALGGIYFSFSRGALLAVLVMPFLLARGRWLLVLAPVTFLASLVALPAVVSERFVVGGADSAEVAGRLDIWSTAAAIWREQPLLGAGLGSFPGSYAAVRVSGKQFLPDTPFEPPPHAHNLELQLLAEQGLVGLVSFVALLATAGWSAVRLRKARERRQRVLGAALLASLVGLLVHNQFDVTLLENTGVQVWGMLGLLSAVGVLNGSKAEADGP